MTTFWPTTTNQTTTTEAVAAEAAVAVINANNAFWLFTHGNSRFTGNFISL